MMVVARGGGVWLAVWWCGGVVVVWCVVVRDGADAQHDDLTGLLVKLVMAVGGVLACCWRRQRLACCAEAPWPNG